MTDLPPGWEWTTFDRVATIRLGRQRSPKNHSGPHMRPYLRSANVTWDGIDLTDVKEMNFSPDETVTFELQTGDLLLNEASGSPSEVGKPAIWAGEIDGCCFQNTLLRVRPIKIATRFLYWYAHFVARTGGFGEAGRGVNIRHLGKQGLASFPLPMPPRAEQERIVAAIEEHLSRLDATQQLIAGVRARINALRPLVIADHLDDPAWPIVAWKDVGETLSGRAFPSKEYRSEGIRLLRPGNLDRSGHVTWKGRSTTYLPLTFAADFPKYRLSGRHLLMNLTAQSLADDFLGRVCLSEPGHVYLLNQRIARLHSDQALDTFLFYVFRSQAFRRFVSGLNTGSLIQHISTRQLAEFKFRLPAIDVQHQVASEITADLDLLDRANAGVIAGDRRLGALRRAILKAAFSGRLVPQDPDDEPAAVLLERIRAEREAAEPTTKRRAEKAARS